MENTDSIKGCEIPILIGLNVVLCDTHLMLWFLTAKANFSLLCFVNDSSCGTLFIYLLPSIANRYLDYNLLLDPKKSDSIYLVVTTATVVFDINKVKERISLPEVFIQELGKPF